MTPREGRVAARPAAGAAMALVVVAGLAARMLYVAAQPETDPAAAAPGLDGGYYLDWASALLEARPGPAGGGAYYLAPLYPFLLWGYLALFGANLAWLFVLQQAMAVGAAGLLFLVGRRVAGEWAGVAGAVLWLGYHPGMFFASRPLGEPVALLLLALSLYLGAGQASARRQAACGAALGLAALARPNLALAGAAWGVGHLAARRIRGALCLGAAAAAVLLPVAARNARASGHLVLVSSNGGVTLYHGNQPGARPTFTLPPWLSGRLDTQRQEATREAERRTGRRLDDVEADRFWGRQALAARLAAPLGTLRLWAARARLCVSSTEPSVDYAPSIDRNPWRRAAPVPFGVLLGLAVGAACVAGWRGSGGYPVWAAVAACAVVPLVFYVSSRYRLPLALALCVPAGIGAAALADARYAPRRRAVAAVVAVVIAVASLAVPADAAVVSGEAVALANRADAWRRVGRPDEARTDLERALRQDPGCVPALVGLGLLAEASGDLDQAERRWREAFERQPAGAGVAARLGRALIRRGDTAGAVDVARRALELRPDDVETWVVLALALAQAGRAEEFSRTLQEAARSGVALEELLRERAGAPAGAGAGDAGQEVER